MLGSGKDSPERLLLLLEQAARGVAAAHAKNIVHRDLKPANILITAQGEPKVGDFGLAHLMDTPATLTRTGTTLGTPLYMAPEQVEGRSGDISPRTDVYALGAILYEAVLGRPPYTAEIVSQLYKQIVEGDVPPPRRVNPRVSRTLEIIILKALSKTPARRYPTALELAEDLRRYREGEPIEAQPPSIVSHLLLRARRNRHILIPAFILAAAAVTILGIQHFEANRTAREQETALQAIRNQVRLSLDAGLRLRRAGDLRGVRALLPPLEAAYREAVTRAPGLAEVDYLMGRMQRALIENQKALEFQNRALKKDPNYAPALYERIVLLSKMWGTFNAARGAEGGLENVFEIPEDLRQGILRDSATLETVLKKGSPDLSSIGQANLQVALGILALHRGSFAQAKGYFQSAIDQDPDLEEAWENLARLQENEKGAVKDVEVLRNVSETLTRAISHDQGYLPYWEELSYVKAWEAVTRHNSGEDPLPMFAEAEKCTDRILTLDPESVSGLTRRGAIHFQRAVYLSQRGRDSSPEFDAAERDYQTALRLEPQSGIAILGRIQTRVFRMIERVKSGIDPAADARAAEEDLARIRVNDKTRKEVDLWQGVIETERAIYGRFQGQDPSEHLAAGERVLSEGIRKYPINTSLWLWRGILRYEQGLNRAARGQDPVGDYTQALQDFDERIRLSGAWPEVWSRRGLALLHAGLYKASLGKDPLPDYRDAEQAFSRALERDKAYGEAWSGQGQVKFRRAIWNDRASESPRDLTRYRSAVADLEQALKLNPTLEREIGTILTEARRKAEAVRNP
jgi:tetratricopeptide (TPR) repeat protein